MSGIGWHHEKTRTKNILIGLSKKTQQTPTPTQTPIGQQEPTPTPTETPEVQLSVNTNTINILHADGTISSSGCTNDTTPTWTWSKPDGGVKYKVKINETGSESEITTETFTSSELSEGGHTLYVRAINANGTESAWSTHFVFVDITPLHKPNPSTFANTVSKRPVWTWNSVKNDGNTLSNIVQYGIRLNDNDEGFTVSSIWSSSASTNLNVGGGEFSQGLSGTDQWQPNYDLPLENTQFMFVQEIVPKLEEVGSHTVTITEPPTRNLSNGISPRQIEFGNTKNYLEQVFHLKIYVHYPCTQKMEKNTI